MPQHKLDPLFDAVRACFREMRSVGDAIHADTGITTAMRAVLEYLIDRGPTPVPDIARAKSVSRQNIQVRVDAMIARGVVELQPNPAHKRSPFVAATKAGRKLFADMRRRESEIVASLPNDGWSDASLATACEVLAAVACSLRDSSAGHSTKTGPTEGENDD